MIPNFDEILLEVSYRIPEGIVDLTQDSHVNVLIDVLKENGVVNPEVVAQKARVYFSYLNEASILEKGKNPAKSIKAVGSRGSAAARPAKSAMKAATQSRAKRPQTGAAQKANSLAKDAQSKGVIHLGRGYYGKSKGSPATFKKDDSGTRLIKIKPGDGPQSKMGAEPAQKGGKQKPSVGGKKSATGTQKQAPVSNIKPSGFISGAEKRIAADKAKDKFAKGGKTRMISGKDKTLQKVDSLNSKEFNRKHAMSDTQFYAKNKKSQIGPPPPLFKFPKDVLKNAKIPKRHLTELERMMNSKLDNDTKKWSHFSDIEGGAGKIPAQAGELMTLISTTLDDKNAAIFFNSLMKHEEMQVQKNPKLAKEGSRIVQKSWILAAANNRKAIRNRLGKEYPGAVIEAGAWDTESEVSALGLKDYKKNKGFSSDAYFKIKTKDGQKILDEVSLKKSLDVNFLNSGAGMFRTWDPNLPDNINQNVYSEKERKGLGTFGKKNLQKLVNISSKNKEVADLVKSKGITVKEAVARILAGKSSRDINNVVYTAIDALAQKGDAGAKKYVAGVQKMHKQFISDSVDALKTNKKLRQGLVNSIREEFPLKAVCEGEESMAIGKYSLDRSIMKEIFGTANFDEIKENLTAVTNSEPPYLAYKAKSSKVTIPIASIGIREDGVGYGGSIKFEMKLDKRFAKVLTLANEKVYGK